MQTGQEQASALHFRAKKASNVLGTYMATSSSRRFVGMSCFVSERKRPSRRPGHAELSGSAFRGTSLT